nr:hypothetical protein [Leuconostoc citreum]
MLMWPVAAMLNVNNTLNTENITTPQAGFDFSMAFGTPLKNDHS